MMIAPRLWSGEPEPAVPSGLQTLGHPSAAGTDWLTVNMLFPSGEIARPTGSFPTGIRPTMADRLKPFETAFAKSSTVLDSDRSSLMKAMVPSPVVAA
jgi:hypothetical protein